MDYAARLNKFLREIISSLMYMISSAQKFLLNRFSIVSFHLYTMQNENWIMRAESIITKLYAVALIISFSFSIEHSYCFIAESI